MSNFMTSVQQCYERLARQDEEIEALCEQLEAYEGENEMLSDLLEALFFFARAEIKEPTFRAFVEEHEELGRMFPVFGVKAVYDGKA